MEGQKQFNPVEVLIHCLAESSAIIAPVFQVQYNGVRNELGDIVTKAGRTMYSRMTHYGKGA